MVWWIYIIALILLLVYIYIKWSFLYWKRKGIEYLEPNFFEGLGDQFLVAYNTFKAKGLKHGGCFAFMKPIYVPVDLDILKHILQIDFHNFSNREGFPNERVDPLRAHLFNQRDDKWRNLRAKLSPTFTSGKMKMMFHTLVENSEGLVEVCKQHSKIQKPIDIKEFSLRYTTDCIVSCAFGLDCNSLQNDNSEYRHFGKRLFDTQKYRQVMVYLLPEYLLHTFNVKLMDPHVEKFILNLVRGTIEYREKNNFTRKDFMQLLLQLKNRNNVADDDSILNEKNETGNFLSIEQIAAQCYLFFAAGFETSATTMTYTLYELAMNQEIQDKLRKEMREVLSHNDGKLTYEAIMQMEYLDRVLNESLRKYAPVLYISRVCKNKYKIPGTDVTLEAGTSVIIPFKSIQNDPEYFPDPDKYDPDRFSPENKAKRHPLAFMPFGEGPRICLGARFGQLQAKIGLTSIISKYRVTLNEKCEVPIKTRKHFVGSVISEVWLNVEEV